MALRGLTLVPPAGWEDDSYLEFRARDVDPRAAPRILVTREHLPPGRSFRTFVARKLTLLARALESMTLLDSGAAPPVAGREAQRVHFRFTRNTDEGALLEQVAILVDGEGDVERLVTIFAITGPVGTLEDAERSLQRILQSVAFDTHAAPAPRRAPDPLPAPEPLMATYPMPGQRAR